MESLSERMVIYMYRSIHESVVLPTGDTRNIYFVGSQYGFIDLYSNEGGKSLVWNGFMQYWEEELSRRFVRWMDKSDEKIIEKCKAYCKEVDDMSTDYDALPF